MAYDDSDEEEFSAEEQPLKIEVKLDHAVYFVGQKITGTVHVRNEHKRRMRGIRLSVRCKAQVTWIEGKEKKETKQINNLDLLYIEKYVIGEGKTTYLEPGTHNLPFSVELIPRGKIVLPSSLEFPNGFVRYYLKSDLDWPWAAAQEHEILFPVIDVVNLRELSSSLQPATFCEVYRVGFPRKKIHIAGRMEKIGYVPGEEILLYMEISNNSRMRITRTFAQLRQVVTYTSASGKTVQTRQVLESNEYGAVAPLSELVLEKQALHIPAIPQSAKQHVSIMTVQYEVALVAETSTGHLEATKEIMIGTLPTKSSYGRFKTGTALDPKTCSWPFGHVDNLPYPKICSPPPNPDINYEVTDKIQTGYRTQYVCFEFDHTRALQLFDADSDDEGDEGFDEEEGDDKVSEFSF